MSEPDLLQLEYAALMHDIGQLSLAGAIPGGATVLASPEDQQRIAELGASVIEQAGVLDQVAQIVRCQCQPWRGRAGEPPVGSRIIRAANAFDDLVGGSADRDRSAAALERLRLDTAAEYDPRVVEALSKVTGRCYPGAPVGCPGDRVGAGRQPGRDSPPGAGARRAGWASGRSPSTPKPTRTSRSSGRRTRRC